MRLKTIRRVGVFVSLVLCSSGLSSAQITGAGTALVFDGVNDQVKVTGFGNSAPTNEVTIEFWQKVSAIKDQYTVSMNLGVATDRLSIMTPWGDGIIYWNYGNVTTSGRLTFPAPVSVTNGWHHFAFVASSSGNYMRIFYDGVLLTNKTGMTPFVRGSFDLLLGFTSPSAFGGSIDEFRLWNTARSSTEILTNMNRRLSGAESNLLLCYHADEGSGTTLSNATAFGFNGTNLSGVLFTNSTAPIGPPVLTTLAATLVTNTTAALGANINPVGQAAGVYFQYGLTTNYTSTSVVTNVVAGTNAVFVSSSLTGLAPGTTYQFRAVATNAGGLAYGSNLTFTTTTQTPVVTTLAATGVGTTNATFNGTLNANSNLTTAYFEYGLTAAYGSVVNVAGSFNGTNTAAVANAVFSLVPGQTYHFRLVATNANGLGLGGDLTFVTTSAAPSAVTLAASAVTSTAATLNSSVSGNGAATAAFFEWGLTTGYGTSTGPQAVPSSAVNASVNAPISGLQPGATYHFRSVASNSFGTTLGGDQSFTAPPLPPASSTVAASGVSPTTATLNGTVTANGSTVAASFQYGTTTSYGSSTSPQNFPADSVAAPFNAPLAGLTPNTLYHFRALAVNSAGTNFGGDQTFTTPQTPPTATTLAAGSVTAGSAVLNGSANPASTNSTAVYFEYGLTSSYGSVSSTTILSGAGAVAVNRSLFGLLGGTTYHFRLVASNAVALALGSNLTFTTLTPAPGPGSAVSFDGVDDKVIVTNFCATAPTNEITIEFWQKVSAVAVQATFTVNTPTANNLINAHIPWVDGNVYWDFGDFENGGRLSYTPPEPIDGTWQHFALVSSQTGNFMKIYRNGVLEAEKSGTTPFVRGNYDLIIGGDALHFAGLIDEFRVWNTARTVGDIQTNMNRRLVGNEADLAAYYRFDEGAGLTAGDSSGHELHATLLNGTAWVASDAPLGLATPTTLAATSITGAGATLNGSVNPGGAATLGFFQWGTTTSYGNVALLTNLGGGSSPIPLAAPLTGLTPGEVYHFRMVASNSLGTSFGPDSYFATPLPVSGTALSLDGVNDFIVTPNIVSLISNETMTIEIWFKANGAGVLVDERGRADLTEWADSQVEILGTGEVLIRVWDLTPVSLGIVSFGTWNHAVLRYDTGAQKLDGFLNGVLSSGSSSGERTSAFEFGYGLFYAIGLADSVNNLGGGAAFSGQVDEFRIWNTARTDSEIANNRNRRLVGSESGLILYYRFDEATGLSAADSSANGFTGSLQNGAAWVGSAAPLFDPPSVATVAASNVTATTATLNGAVTANGLTTAVIFEWGTTTSYGSNTAPQLIASNAVGAAFNAPLAGLTPGVTYHFRAVAANATGTNFGGDLSFTPPLVVPAITTLAASSVTSTSATLNGSVTANGSAAGAYFQWGTTTNYGAATTPQNFAGNAIAAACSAPLSGLVPGVTYHFRAVATNAAGTNFGGDLTFTTLIDPPSVTTLPASTVTHSGATLNGTVNPNGTSAFAYFEFGPTASYGSSTNVTNILNGTSAVAMSNSLTGLTPGAVYHFRLVATNSTGPVFGADRSFTNPPLPSVVGSGVLGNGQFRMQFSGEAGLGYTVLGATNLNSPVLWLPLGPATPLGGGAFEFTDADTTNFPARFYQLRSP